jgi:hypothetical protein
VVGTDAIYLFAHSKLADVELRYSLRSLERAAAWVRKVWVFGDRPEWLAEDRAAIEHVPHEAMAKLGRWKLPLRNTFLMTFLSSLIPGLSDEFLWMADDYILLRPVEQADLCRVRVLEDLKTLNRGKGLWKDTLWRTHDTLVRLGYGSLNFECHLPMFLKRKWVWDAYCDLQDYVTEDRFYGLLMATSVLNHAMKHNGLTDLVWPHEEGRFVGFYKSSPTLDEVRAKTAGNAFMNFDDPAWGPGIERFLAERFPERSKFEQ